MTTLENNWLRIQTSENGAELSSVVGLKTNFEYLHKGKQPISFPYGGTLNPNNKYSKGKVSEFLKGGLISDKTFEIIEETPKTVVYRLESDGTTHNIYPHPYRLDVSYKLRAYHINVFWKILNTGIYSLPFQIGGELTFNLPPFMGEKGHFGYFNFRHASPLSCLVKNGDGFISRRHSNVHLINGNFRIVDNKQEEEPIYYVDKNQVKQVSVLDIYERPFISLAASCPVFRFNTNFNDLKPSMTLAPIWGIDDRDDYVGEFSNRPNTIILPPGHSVELIHVLTLNAEYTFFVGRSEAKKAGFLVH